MSRKTTIVTSGITLLAWTAWFVLSTSAVGTVPAAAWFGTCGVIATVVVLAVTPGGLSLRFVREPGRLPALAAGAVAFGAAPFLVASNRFSDAPPGSEVLFLTTTVWAALAVLLAWAIAVRSEPALRPAGALVAVLGAAAIAASLERPSSFSPFVRYAPQEAVFLAGGLAFAAALLVLGRLAVRDGADATARSAAVGAGAFGLLAWGFSAFGGAGQVLGALMLPTLGGLAMAGVLLGTVRLAASHGVSRSVVPLALVPVGLLVVSPLERGFAPLGPVPLLWAGVLAGTLLLAAGCTAIWIAPSLHRLAAVVDDAPARRTTYPRALLLLGGGVLVVIGIWVLGAPVLSATAAGVLDSGVGYRATWELVGAETVVGWLPLLGGLGLLAAWFDVVRGASSRRVAALGATLAFCALLWPLVAATPLHTWTRWVPVDIQQAYGTEYASFSVRSVAPGRLVRGFPVLAEPRVRMGADVEFEPSTAPGEVGPVGSLERYTPDRIGGWTAQDATALSANSLTRSYSAPGGVTVTVMVEQFRSAEEASEAVDRALASYGTVSTEQVGTQQVRTASDGSGGVSAGWVEGTVSVVVEVLGADATSASRAATEAVRAIAR